MANYRAIKGYMVQSLSSDPSNIFTGQIWYNTTLGKFRGVKEVGAWSSGGNINIARANHSGARAAPSTAAQIAGGQTPPNTEKDETEQYDGTSWTEVGDLNSVRRSSTGFGTQAAAINVSGVSGGAGSTLCESWNGTSWTEVQNNNTYKANAGGGGTATAGICAQTTTEIWNGASWTEVGDMNEGRYGGGSAGTSTALIYAGGHEPPTPTDSPDACETWNGTSWTEGNNLNQTREVIGDFGTSTAAMMAGGLFEQPYTYLDVCEQYDGTSFTEVADLSLARGMTANGAGTTSAGVICGGRFQTVANAHFTNVSEEWSFAAATSSWTTT